MPIDITLLERARAGDAQAQYEVGRLYEGGISVKRDYQAAFSWIKQAAEQGHIYAQAL